MEKKKKEKAGYFNFTMVMMNGQLATGIVEQVWGKLKARGMKQTLLLLVFAMLRIGANFAKRPVIHTAVLKRELNKLVKVQSDPDGFRLDKATYNIVRQSNLLCDSTS